MDTGHFISFHADSPGNIPYNIVGDGAHQTVEAGGETKTKGAESMHWHNMSAFLMDTLTSLNAEHSGRTPVMLFFYCLCGLQLQRVLGSQFTTDSCVAILVFRISGGILHVSGMRKVTITDTKGPVNAVSVFKFFQTENHRLLL